MTDGDLPHNDIPNPIPQGPKSGRNWGWNPNWVPGTVAGERAFFVPEDWRRREVTV